MDPIDTLRYRACWPQAAELLSRAAVHDPFAAVQRAQVLVEQSVYTLDSWTEAEDAVVTAERLCEGDAELRAAAALERSFLAYNATVLSLGSRGDEAREAIRTADTLLSKESKRRGLLDFRRGLILENLDDDAPAGHAAYRSARRRASATEDEWLLSYTARHLGIAALEIDDVDVAHAQLEESLRLRVSCGFMVGVAPALVLLAQACQEEESGRLRSEAARLVVAFGGIPAWLRDVS